MKRAGRKVKNFDASLWEQESKQIVYDGNYAEWSHNISLRDIMLNSKDKIFVEAAHWDNVWGIGIGTLNPDLEDSNKWKGTNYLGFILTKVKEDLMKEYK